MCSRQERPSLQGNQDLLTWHDPPVRGDRTLIAGAASLLGFRRPIDEEADVARHAAREVDDHGLELVALRLPEFLVALVELLGFASQGFGPLRIAAVDGRPLSVHRSEGKL